MSFDPVSYLMGAKSGGGGGGSGGGVLMVNWDDDTGVLDKTWQEIYDAPFSAVSSVYEGAKTIGFVSYVSNPAEGEYSVAVYVDFGTGVGESVWFKTTSASGYPVIPDEG